MFVKYSRSHRTNGTFHGHHCLAAAVTGAWATRALVVAPPLAKAHQVTTVPT